MIAAAAAAAVTAACAAGASPETAGSNLTLGASILWSAAVKPIKQPVSTLHRGVMMGMEGTGNLIEAPLEYLTAEQFGAAPPALAGRPGMDLTEWERVLDALTGTRQTHGTARFLVDGDQFYPALFEAIASARRSIDMRVYIFDTDDIALAVADELRRRAASVRTRVLLDGIGSAWAAIERPETLPAGHRVPPSITTYLRQGSAVRVRLQANPLLAGDHTKTIVIDGERAFLGGMNIGREYRHEWHDMMVELSGPVVAEIDRSFRAAWARASIFGDLAALIDAARRNRVSSSGGGAPMRLLATRPGDDQIRRARMAAIARAQSHIYLETPYLADADLVDALVAARHRGVDVRIILPRDNDSAIMADRNRAAALRLSGAGVRVFIYPGFTHAKAMVVDGWALFGSSNADWLSHAVNREMDIATSDPDIVGRLTESLFHRDFAASREYRRPPALILADHGVIDRPVR